MQDAVTDRAVRMVLHAILELGQRSVGYTDIAEAASYSRAQTARTLRLLLAHGLIVREGNGGRGGYRYRVNAARAGDLMFHNIDLDLLCR